MVAMCAEAGHLVEVESVVEAVAEVARRLSSEPGHVIPGGAGCFQLLSGCLPSVMPHPGFPALKTALSPVLLTGLDG